MDIAVDAAGNSYVVGRLSGPTLALGSFILSGGGLFVAKYDPNGNVLWANRVGPDGVDSSITGYWIPRLAADNSGNAYLVGTLASVSVDGCALTNAGGFRFIFKLAANGQALWCRKIGEFSNAPPYAEGAAIDCDVDALGNCYVAGVFQGVVSFDGITLTNAGGTGSYPGDYPSYFLAKANPQGTFVWAKNFGAYDTETHGEPGYDLPSVRAAVDAQGDCSFAAGFSRTNCIFDSFTLNPFGISDAVVARLDAEPPRLRILHSGNSVVISWPTNQPSFALECASGLPATNGWIAVTNPASLFDGLNFVTNPVTTSSQFYRLRKQ